MLPSTHSETRISISICTPESAYPRFHDAILSTKYFDDETRLAYYGYRYYSPEMGRWLSRDPIGERGGGNLYSFVANNSVDSFDIHGLLSVEAKCSWGCVTFGPIVGIGVCSLDCSGYIGCTECAKCPDECWEWRGSFKASFLVISGGSPVTGSAFDTTFTCDAGTPCPDDESRLRLMWASTGASVRCGSFVVGGGKSACAFRLGDCVSANVGTAIGLDVGIDVSFAGWSHGVTSWSSACDCDASIYDGGYDVWAY